MLKYFIYCRKSTEEEERQILSIETQLAELREFAKQNNLFVVKEFCESKTAKEPGREVFNFILHRQFKKFRFNIFCPPKPEPRAKRGARPKQIV